MSDYSDPPFDPRKKALLLFSGSAAVGGGLLSAIDGAASETWWQIVVGVPFVLFGAMVFFAGWTWRRD